MLDYRTWGETENCGGCRYWSEMIAKCDGGPLEAMCLCGESEHSGKYTTHYITCDKWAEGSDGAVDEYGSDPLRYEAQTSD